MSELYMEPSDKPPKAEPIEFNLTADQWAYIMSKLPKGISLQESKKIPKRQKKEPTSKYPELDVQSLVTQTPSSAKDGSMREIEDPGQKLKRQRKKNVDRYLQPQPPRPKLKHIIPSQKLSDEEMTRCNSYLQQLKKNINAWPFLQPVNPVKLGLTDYFDIVKQPMDLSTVEKNLRNHQYSTMNQFHADINKIWLNSYRYNQKGSDIYRLTTEMQKYYKRLTMKSVEDNIYMQPVYTQPPSYKKPTVPKERPHPPPKTPKPKNAHHQMTITEKRQLCQEIKKLPKEHLSGIWKIVANGRDGPNLELDVEKLETDKLWKLHAYVREVNSRGTTIKKPEEKKLPTDQRHAEYPQPEPHSPDSSFIIDSESDN